MKKLLSYIFVFLAVTACSTEDIVTTPDTETDVTTETEGIKVEIEAPVGLGDADASRSTIVYDDDKNIMAFKWNDGDSIGVFTLTDDPTKSQQQKFAQVKDDSDTDLLRTFKTQDGKLKVNPNFKYLACLPYIEEHTLNYTLNYTNIPIDYTGQCQTEPVDFRKYRTDKKDSDYKKSQPKASAHLSKYDFLCTGETEPTPTGGILFKMNRMGAFVRFWIVIKPENNYVYDELQLVNNSKMFTTKATMNAKDMTLTATEESHTITLQLGEEGKGFDLTEQTNDGENSTTPFYDWKKESNTYTGYIMAYMMLAPINLQGDDVENCFIYLVAHEKEHPENKHYFKSPGLSKPNLQKNSFYKWTVYPDEDMPIEVSSITVEEWREGTSIENNGIGTGSW